MTIRGVLMWYLGAIIVVGGSGAAGYTAIKQHRALLAEQSATTKVAEQAPAPSPAAPAETAAIQTAAATPAPHPSPAAATKTAVAPIGRPWPALPKAEALAEATPAAAEAPTVPSWAVEIPAPQPSRSPRKPVIAHNNSGGKHAAHVVVASLHRPVERPNPPRRPAVYAAAHAPATPRVTYYAYPGYYPYQSGYPYYSYYSRYSRYPYYSTY